MPEASDMKQIVIEYEETYVCKGKPLEVSAPSAECVRVLDVTQVADDLRYRYAIIWENGDA